MSDVTIKISVDPASGVRGMSADTGAGPVPTELSAAMAAVETAVDAPAVAAVGRPGSVKPLDQQDVLVSDSNDACVRSADSAFAGEIEQASQRGARPFLLRQDG